MKIVKKGEVTKINGGYHVSKATVDCEGEPIHIDDFLRAHGIPTNSKVAIEAIDGTDPDFYIRGIRLTEK